MGYVPLTAMAGAEPKGNGAECSTGVRLRLPGVARPMYPLGRPAGPIVRPTIRASLPAEAPCPPAPSCSSTPIAPSAEAITHRSDRRRLHRHDRRRPGRGVRQGRRPPARRSSTSSSGEKTAFDVCREIRATPALRPIPVLCVGQTDDVEERIRFLEAGADDVMAKPFDARELEARVEALLLRFQRSKDLTAVVSTRRHHRHPPSAGPSRSTARRAASGRRRSRRTSRWRPPSEKPDRVVLVDLDLQFGQVATHLNVEPRQTLADVVRDEAALREPELLRTYATRHDSGLHVLAAPTAPELAELITADHVDKILTTLLETYDQVVDRHRVVARRADDDRVRARRDRAVRRQPGDRGRSRRWSACSST